MASLVLLACAALFSLLCAAQDDLGIAAGYTSFSTKNFDFKLVSSSQTLASLKASGQTFDFSPFDYIQYRSRDGQYHLGDITYRYRLEGQTAWTSGDSATKRTPVSNVTSSGALSTSDLKPTLPSGSALHVVRSWSALDGDVALSFNLTNTATSSMEIGSLGLPIEFNSIFSNRAAEDTQAKCSLHDPYIGLDAGYVRVTPVSGTGASLVVTPLNGTRFEGWRNLPEQQYNDIGYGSQTFEGFYEWQAFTLAYAQNEWNSTTPWNKATSRMLKAGESTVIGLRFSLAKGGVADIESTIKSTGLPYVVGVPGYVVPQDLTAKLNVYNKAKVTHITTEPADAFQVTGNNGSYSLKPSSTAWGRVRLTISYADGKTQSVHYYITKAGPAVLSDIGKFSTTSQWFTDTSDPFHRAPSVMTYDREVNKIVDQDSRVWIAGLSDEGGAGSYVAATMKQSAQPNADEVAKLEQFVNQVLWGQIQNKDYSVKKSIFFYEPNAVPGYKYRTDADWSSWTSWNKSAAAGTGRAYDYVHPAAAYWAMYRVARAYPDLVKVHSWDWYLTQAYKTIFSLFRLSGGTTTVGYALLGLMEETIFGEILNDVYREGYKDIGDQIKGNMSYRASRWDKEAVPFGSEMAWDSTGQEGVYYWSKYFGYKNTATKAFNTVLGFMPTVPHWGYNGNARRYWDNIYGGKLKRIERQIHHYGSGLNSLVLLSQYRSDPSAANSHVLRTAFGGSMGPLTNIDQSGASAASFHAFPDTLKWDGYSGDYGMGFLGMILGSATYIAEDQELGLVTFGGETIATDTGITVQPRDAVRRKVYVGPLGLLIEIDAGVIQEVAYKSGEKSVEVKLGQLDGVPKTKAAVMWLTTESGTLKFAAKGDGVTAARGGSSIPLTGSSTTVTVFAQ